MVGPTCSPWQPMGSGLTHAAPRGATGPPPPPPATLRLGPRAGGLGDGAPSEARRRGAGAKRAGPTLPRGRGGGRADPTGPGLQVAQRGFLPARTAVDPADLRAALLALVSPSGGPAGGAPFLGAERRRPSAAAGLRSCSWRRRGFYRDRLVVTGISRLIHRKASAYAMTRARRQREI